MCPTDQETYRLTGVGARDATASKTHCFQYSFEKKKTASILFTLIGDDSSYMKKVDNRPLSLNAFLVHVGGFKKKLNNKKREAFLTTCQV